MRTRLFAPLMLLPLALNACPAPAKPPVMSLKACRIDEDTARVSWWVVPRGRRIVLQIPGAALYEPRSPSDEFALEAPIDGRTVTVTAYVGMPGAELVGTDYELWATRYC